MSIYMPMVCELPIAMLACARIGAVHSVVFGGFSAEALAGVWGDRLGAATRVVAAATMALRVCWMLVSGLLFTVHGALITRRSLRDLLCRFLGCLIVSHLICCGPCLCTIIQHAGRMHDCEAKVLLTASGVMRGNKKIDLKAIADSGLDMCEKQGEQGGRVSRNC